MMTEQELLSLRVQEAYEETLLNLARNLYGDDHQVRQLPRQSIREQLSNLKWRIQCAWLVLRGKADIS